MEKIKRYPILVFVMLCIASCATQGDLQRLETKLDQLVKANKIASLQQLFIEDSNSMQQKLNNLNDSQSKQFQEIQESYSSGKISTEHFREQILAVLGNNDREVFPEKGILIRNLEGKKIAAIAKGTRITHSRLLSRPELPELIESQKSLQRYQWGVGELNGDNVMFPWELTISMLAKEIANHTSRRIINDSFRVGGERNLSRPVYIQVSVKDQEILDVNSADEEAEVYLITGESLSDSVDSTER